MNFAPIYLVKRFVYRAFDFFHHWYVDGSRIITNWFLVRFYSFERVFALRETLRFFFHPLFKDYTIVGRVLGVIFRSIRIIIGIFVYGILGGIFVIVYVIWLMIPVGIVARIILGLGQ